MHVIVQDGMKAQKVGQPPIAARFYWTLELSLFEVYSCSKHRA